ncbi:MAG TPA: NUDIX domain-containing protein [Chryseosolibacter sp.]
MASPNLAAGLLMCKPEGGALYFFLVHPGGPFFKNKDAGAWTIPKGVPEPNEELPTAAIREFEEETGIKPSGEFHPLGTVQQRGGKIIHAWAFSGQWEANDGITSNTFSLEWPPKSGKFRDFPEVDRAGWFAYEEAVQKINPAQTAFLDRAKQFF